MDDEAPAPLPYLTPRERKYLWYIAQGLTPREAFPLMGCKSSPSVNTRVCEKLGARRIEQAIFKACMIDLIGPHLDCGTAAGYKAHHGRHEDACRACRRWYIDFTERQGVVTAVRPVPLTDDELRLLRSYDAGLTFVKTLQKWGCSRAKLTYVRTQLYKKLDVAHLPQGSKVQASLEAGRRLGYLRPGPAVKVDRKPRRWGTTDLTDLEFRTLKVLATGASLAQAGAQLGGITGPAVSSRLAIIYRKLDVLHVPRGAERRGAAVKEARNRGYEL